jgi:DNA repair photolyase
MDLQAWLNENETSEETRETYRYFMRPEPKDIVSEILVDEETGQRYRWLKVGMVRNASDDSRKPTKVYLDPFPHIRIPDAKPLQGWYKAKVEQAGVRNRPCFTEAMLTQPYGGYCAIGCGFCYINSGMRGYRGTGLVSVPMNYGEQVRTQLSKIKTSAAGYFSSFTEPFFDLEKIYHNTQQGAQAFVDNGLPIFFLSRLQYPDWTYGLLKKSKYSYAQKSINTPHQEIWRRLSPGAAPLETHFEDIRRLRSEGIYVSIQVNPVVPGIVSHDDIELLFEKLADAGANHVIIKFVEASFSWAPTMVENMRKRFDDARADAFDALFKENIGGQRTIVEEYRMEGHRRYSAAAKRCGLTYATCYEYKMERNQYGEVINKLGKSIGSEFLTADQCHGHRVPMFTRKDLSQPFQEVEECPPSGCLTCSDDNDGKPRCDSGLFGQALALRSSDFKKSVRDEIPFPILNNKPKNPSDFENIFEG